MSCQTTGDRDSIRDDQVMAETLDTTVPAARLSLITSPVANVGASPLARDSTPLLIVARELTGSANPPERVRQMKQGGSLAAALIGSEEVTGSTPERSESIRCRL